MRKNTRRAVVTMIPKLVQLGMAVVLGISLFPKPALSIPESSVYTGGAAGAADPPIPCTGGETVLLIQDNVPWFAPANQDPLGANVTELKTQGKHFCMISSQDIGMTNLAQFSEILMSAAQTQTFYNNLFPEGVIHPAITAWVQHGGVLSANLTDCASGPGAGGTWAIQFCNANVTTSFTFVGGVKHVQSIQQDNDIADPGHPIIADALACPGGHCATIVDVASLNDLDDWNFASHGYFIDLPIGTTVILTERPNGQPVMIDYPFGAGRVIAALTTTEWRYAGDFGSLPQNRKLLANEIAYQDSLAAIEVPVDIKPQSCPNPLNTNAQGVLPVAILGTATFDVTKIDVATVKLAGVSPLRSALEDVATPFVPFIGKMAPFDCTVAGPDGFLDLTLKFDNQAVVAALGTVTDGEVLVLKLTGKLLPAFGGTPIAGEDVVVIQKKK
jgi:hypothetical protein